MHIPASIKMASFYLLFVAYIQDTSHEFNYNFNGADWTTDFETCRGNS